MGPVYTSGQSLRRLSSTMTGMPHHRAIAIGYKVRQVFDLALLQTAMQCGARAIFVMALVYPDRVSLAVSFGIQMAGQGAIVDR